MDASDVVENLSRQLKLNAESFHHQLPIINTNIEKNNNFFIEEPKITGRVKRCFRELFFHGERRRKVFGRQLKLKTISTILPLVSHLEKNADKQGIFRISGSQRQVRKLKQKLDLRVNVDLDRLSVHTVVSTLKKFVTELPTALVEPVVYDHLSNGFDRAENKIEFAKNVLLCLPFCNRLLLRKILHMLNTVAENEQNQMPVENIARCFTKMFPELNITQIEMAAEIATRRQQIMEFLIENSDLLFELPAEPEDLSWFSQGYDVFDDIVEEQNLNRLLREVRSLFYVREEETTPVFDEAPDLLAWFKFGLNVAEYPRKRKAPGYTIEDVMDMFYHNLPAHARGRLW